jgi:hypothetical protein
MKLHFSIGTLVVLLASTLLILTGADRASAMVNSIPIQGKLTDSAGNSLNGTYSFKITIYNAATAGTALCTNTKDVTVTNGLFNTTLSNCFSHEFGGVTQLYLGIQVGSDEEMTPRQALASVPFAYGLVDGILSSGASTYIWVPGAQLVRETSTDTTTWDLAQGGSVYLKATTTGNKSVRIPISIPGVLYGQPVQIREARVYYKCQNGLTNYITGTYLTKNTDADTASTLHSDSTNRQSNVAGYYILDSLTNNTLDSTQGILTLGLTLTINDVNLYVQIAGVRLTLDTNF